jgi:predicted ATPase
VGLSPPPTPPPDVTLRVRIGIATGLVVVGDLLGEGAAREQAVVGEPPIIAARLQQTAEPDTVVVADSTRRLLGRMFELEDLGLQQLKNIGRPNRAWRVASARSLESRYDSTHAENIVGSVGRDQELALLLERWRSACAGRGQVVLLSGEPGIGKSRLCAMLQDWLGLQPISLVRWQCSPLHMGSALYPIIATLERSMGIEPQESADVKSRRLVDVLTRANSSVPVSLFATLLSIEAEGSPPPSVLMAGEQKRRTLLALSDWLFEQAAGRPLLCILEDAQWSDPTTKDFIELCIERFKSAPALLIVTYRSDFESTWSRYDHASALTLHRLSQPQAAELVGSIVGAKSLPTEVLEHILAKADGVPLFVEELTKAILESDLLLEGADRFVTSGPLPAHDVPTTLQDSLLARLDRPIPVKEVAQMAAVIGREFSYHLLRALAPYANGALNAALAELQRAELVHVRGRSPNARYIFKHALVQDAAYNMLLHSERQKLHARIANILKDQFRHEAERQPEVLAHHFAQAGVAEAAVEWWWKAGERSFQLSANVETIANLRRGLAVLQSMPESGERDRRELDFQTRLGAALTTVNGFADRDVAVAFERARTLCPQSDDPAQRFSVLRGLWVYDLVRAEWRAADNLAEEMLALAHEQNDAGYQLEANRALGMTLLWRGEFVRARGQLEQGRRIYDPEQHHTHAYRYGNDPGIACMVHEALVLWILGYPDQALAMSREAVSLARRLAHPFSIAQALVYSTFVHQCRREAQFIPELAEEAKALAVKHGFRFWLAEATMSGGWAMAVQGEVTQGLENLQNGISDFLATGARMDKPRWFALLAEVYCRDKKPKEAFDVLSEALAVVEETGECIFEARIRQLGGELELACGGPDAAAGAEARLKEALAVARRQGARSWELRTATSLARLWVQQSRRPEARELLAPVYGWFSEGFETADLDDAKSLLEALT